MKRMAGTIALFALLLWASPATAERFEVAPGSDGTEVVFESKAPLETFQGKTSALTAIIDLNRENLNDSVAVSVEIALDSLDTGIPVRNRHMRENHLETGRFPTARFESIALVEPHPDRFLEGRALGFEVEGRLTLHGVTRPVVLPVTVTQVTTDGRVELLAESRFEVKLSDYGIDRPQFLVMKLGDAQKIHFRARAARAGEGR